MTVNKRDLAREIIRITREWGQNAIAFRDGLVTEAWFHRARKRAQEELVLYSGALASIVIRETSLPVMADVVKSKSLATTEF